MGITDPEDIKNIVDNHNDLRRRVAKGLETRGKKGKEGQPAASNMMQVEWDPEVAKMAQTWVDQCSGAHDSNRNMESGYCGQNYAGSWTTSGPSPASPENFKGWADMWYGEVDNFDRDDIAAFGKGNHTGTVGHYTQVIWASVTKIGCGYRYNYDGKKWFGSTVICNYCPGGNWGGAQIYKVREKDGKMECPEGSTENDGLCKLDKAN